jgi:hypothetical protein
MSENGTERPRFEMRRRILIEAPPQPASSISATVPCSSTPARMRPST